MNPPIQKPSPRKKISVIIFTVFFGVLILHLLYERSSDRDWAAYKESAAARGEPVEWQRQVPSVPPMGENFYGAPIAQKWMPKKGGDSAMGSPLITRKCRLHRAKERHRIQTIRGK